VEPIVHHLKNYGLEIWYDRYKTTLGDNLRTRCLDEGAAGGAYAVVILSKHTVKSSFAMEELSILKLRHHQKLVTIFPILYEFSPSNMPAELSWMKELIFKEVDKQSGTREICNHIACKITSDILRECKHQNIQEIVDSQISLLDFASYSFLRRYQEIDRANLNSRITLLYAVYLILIQLETIKQKAQINMISKIFHRLFSETSLSLDIDYRELWLLENSICILIDRYLASRTESKM